MTAQGPFDAAEKQAEDLVTEHLRRRLVRYGQREAAENLPRHVRATLANRAEAGAFTTFAFEIHARVADFHVRLGVRDGALMGWSFPLAAEDAGQRLSVSEALALAEAAADLPEGAVRTVAAYEEIGGETFFVARWEHHEGGIPVEGDFVQLTLNGKTGRAIALARRWHTVSFELSER